MFGPLVLELIVVFLATLGLLHHYGQIRKQHIMVTIATLVSWYFSMIIVFILPLDVSSTFYRQCVQMEAPKLPVTIPILNVTNNTMMNPTINKRDVQEMLRPDSSNTSDVIMPTSITTTTMNNTSTHLPVLNVSTLSMVNVTHISLNVTSFSVTSSEYNSSSGSSSNTSSEVPPPLLGEVKVSKCQKPWSYVPDETLPIMWILVYWSSQILTWLFLPFIQSYVCAGDFSIVGKVKRALLENAIYYGSYLFVLGILLVYIAISPSISLNMVQIKVLVITASNTWGLFLLILLLGYGLVEVPRRLWDKSDPQLTITRTYFALSKLSTEKQEAHENLEDLLEEVKRVSQKVRYNHPSRKYVNIIISKCSDGFQESLVHDGIDDFQEYRANNNEVPPENNLVRLHKQLLQALDTMRRTSVQYKILMNRAVHLENLLKNSVGVPDRTWKEEVPLVEQKENYFVRTFMSLRMKWKWYCQIQPWLRKIGAVCLAVLTVMVIWSECTFFNETPVLSLFAIFINLAKSNYDYIYIELASCTVIFYLCFCAYYTVFRIKFFNYYYIAGHHQTNESSLLFVGMMLCRLTAPLCLNFLGLIHLDTPLETNDGSRGVETSYTQIMGHLELITFISEGFNIYFPILVLILCIATYFEIGQRCLTMIGFQRFIDGNIDDLASDLISDGKQLVIREKRRIQRELNAIHRNEQINQITNGDYTPDVSKRQWKGKYMQKYETRNTDDQSTTSSTTSSSKILGGGGGNEKMEFFEDNSMDYNSLAPATDHHSRWSDSPGGGATSSSVPVISRPPRNLFDDV